MIIHSIFSRLDLGDYLDQIKPWVLSWLFLSGAALAYLVRFIQSLESLGTLILRLTFPLIGAYRAVVIDLWDACL